MNPLAVAATASLAAVFAGLSFDGALAELNRRATDDRATLASDRVAFSEQAHLQAKRTLLRDRLRAMLRDDAEAQLIRELGRIAHRRHVWIEEAATLARAQTHLLAESTGERLTLRLRGTYRDLLLSLDDLSLGPAVVDVDTPTISKQGGQLEASIPVTLVVDGPRT